MPYGQGLQNAVESYNGRWRGKVWHRYEHLDLAALQCFSDTYSNASQIHTKLRRKSASAWRMWPAKSPGDIPLAELLAVTIIFLRRSNEDCVVSFLGRQFLMHPDWEYRLVRAEVDMPDLIIINFYPLRRKAPSEQPLVNSVPYFPLTKAPH